MQEKMSSYLQIVAVFIVEIDDCLPLLL